MKRNSFFVVILALALIPPDCNAETAVKDTVAGSTWSGMVNGDPVTFTFAKEGGTFEGLSGGVYLERGYKVVAGVEITMEGSPEASGWGFIDEGTLSIGNIPFIKIYRNDY